MCHLQTSLLASCSAWQGLKSEPVLQFSVHLWAPQLGALFSKCYQQIDFIPSCFTGRTLAFLVSPRWVQYQKCPGGCPAVFCPSSLYWFVWCLSVPWGPGEVCWFWDMRWDASVWTQSTWVKEVIFERKNSESQASIPCTGRSEFSLHCL